MKQNEMDHNKIDRGALLLSGGFLLALFFFMLGLHYPKIGRMGIFFSIVIGIIGLVLAIKDLKKYKE